MSESQHGCRDATYARSFASAKRPFAAALLALAPDKKAILAQWKRHLHNLHAGETPNPEIALWKAVQSVPRMTFPSFRSGIESLGEDFGRRGLSADQVIASIDALQETALQCLTKGPPGHSVALVRMNSLASNILISTLLRRWGAHVEALESELKDAEQRLLGTSSYVTRIYESERRRLSHDLHDEIGHELVVLKLRMELIAADVNRRKYNLIAPRMNDALELVGRAIDSVRRLVMDLGPAVFDDLGFLPAIRLYARQFSASTGIEVLVRDGGMSADLVLSHQTALYRVLQGALSNVLRHARAKHVKVAFACLKSSILVMTIEDDGIGFDVTAARTCQRFGLTAMRERIAVLGGRIHVQSWPASPLGGRRGTRIEVDLPLSGGCPV